MMNMDAGKTPYVVAIVTQLFYTGSFVISKAAYDEGLDIFVFVFYRQAFGSALLLPLTLLLQRKAARSMSCRLLLMLFIRALIGLTSLSLYQVSLKYTSATVVSAIDNSLPAVTFFMALLLRMESVKLKNISGIGKLTGVALSLAGVLVIAFYVGPALSPVNHHRAFASHASGSGAHVITRGAWVKYTFLMVVANMAFALCIVMLPPILKECPNKLLITTVQSVFTVLQSFVATVVFQRDFSRWKLQFDVSLLAVLYSGFVVMGGNTYLQAWCVEMKGPVFLSVWTPLCFVFTMFCSSFFLGEVVHLGSIIGASLLVGGLYIVLWGKTNENKVGDGEKHEEHQQENPAEKKRNSDVEDQEHRMENGHKWGPGI